MQFTSLLQDFSNLLYVDFSSLCLLTISLSGLQLVDWVYASIAVFQWTVWFSPSKRLRGKILDISFTYACVECMWPWRYQEMGGVHGERLPLILLVLDYHEIESAHVHTASTDRPQLKSRLRCASTTLCWVVVCVMVLYMQHFCLGKCFYSCILWFCIA